MSVLFGGCRYVGCVWAGLSDTPATQLPLRPLLPAYLCVLRRGLGLGLGRGLGHQEPPCSTWWDCMGCQGDWSILVISASSCVHRGGCWGLPHLYPNPETTRCSVACEIGVVGVRSTYVATVLATAGDVAGWHGQERDGMPPSVATRGSPEFPALSTNMGGLAGGF